MNFFTKNPNLKKIVFLGGGGVCGEGGCWEGKMDGQTNKPKPICPIQLLRSWGHNNALMYKLCKLCPRQAQFMTILSFDLQVCS